jgi:transcriptional regulator with XRE-family HTH domain
MHVNGIISNDKIGTMIRRRRHELSFSQEELASKLGVSRQQVQRYENGKDMLSVEMLQTLCHLLSVHVTYFFSHTGDGTIQEDELESELLSHYKKIRSVEAKRLVVGFARTVSCVGSSD